MIVYPPNLASSSKMSSNEVAMRDLAPYIPAFRRIITNFIMDIIHDLPPKGYHFKTKPDDQFKRDRFSSLDDLIDHHTKNLMIKFINTFILIDEEDLSIQEIKENRDIFYICGFDMEIRTYANRYMRDDFEHIMYLLTSYLVKYFEIDSDYLWDNAEKRIKKGLMPIFMDVIIRPLLDEWMASDISSIVISFIIL